MIEIHFNGVDQRVESVEQLGLALDAFDRKDQFELWCFSPNGPSLCMLRNGSCAWLMYLRFSEDAGYHSIGAVDSDGMASYRLSNGQIDEYPVAWCIDVEQCYRAVAYFFVNSGAQPPWVTWQAD